MLDLHPLATWLRSLTSQVTLSKSDCDAILALAPEVRTHSAHYTLVREGERPTVCCVLVEGFAIRIKSTSSGERAIVGVQIPGDALDIQHLYLDCADHDVQMLTSGRLAAIPRSALRALAAEHPAIGHAFCMAAQVDASILREWLLNVGRRSARSRTAHLFCELAARLNARGLTVADAFELPMTQEQMGDVLGLTAVHINRTIKALEMEGLLCRSHRTVHVADWPGLRTAAEFDELYLHMDQPHG